MKRNESILVYGVAGLLVLILGVAVVFGNERDQADGSAPPGEEIGVAKTGDGTVTDDTLSLDDLLAEPQHPAGPLAKETPSGEPLAADASAAGLVAADAVQQPLEKRATAELLAALGETRRDGDYRVVKVRKGDSLSVLVQRWCGSLDDLAVAEALNEDVNPQLLKQGQEIYLPWVDDAVIGAQLEERAVVNAKVDSDKGRTYTLKQGDMLWDLAVAATGSQSRAPKYIERLMQLNPGLVPESLKVGQRIVLPPVD